MTTEQILMLVTIGGYLVIMLLIGVWFSRRNNSVDDFYLGGRKLGPFVTAMSAEASDMSSWLLMNLSKLADRLQTAPELLSCVQQLDYHSGLLLEPLSR